MLRIKPYTILIAKNPKPPPGPDWIQQWHGYYHPPELARIKGKKRLNEDRCLYPLTYTGVDTTYGYLEMMGFLSILEFYAGKHFNFVELGAGIGYWCTVLAAVLEYEILPKSPASYRALAVEADPTHYQLAVKCISSQGIDAAVVNKAVTSTIGIGLFSAEDPYLQWGQHLFHSPKKDSIEVETTIIDLLLSNHSFAEVSLVHMDVQAEEINVVKGAQGAIRAGQIQHFIIEVHDKHNNWTIGNRLKDLLCPSYNLIVDLPRYKTVRFDNFPNPIFGEAGIQIWQLKGLND